MNESATIPFDPQTALANGTQKKVPITELVPDATGLRKDVNKKDSKWPGLVDSIRADGIMQNITVRVNNLPEADHPYIIVDGFHRFTAAMEIWEEKQAEREAAGEPPLDPSNFLVPVNIVQVGSALDVYRLQLTGNLQSIDTRPVQVRDHLLSIIAEARDQGLEFTQADLAKEINKSQSYVSMILKTTKLTDEVAKIVDESGMTISNAHNLAKLPPEEQMEWVDRAKNLDAEEFALQVGQEIRKLKEAAASERKSRGDEFPGVAPKLVSKTDALKMMDAWFKERFEPNGGEAFVNGVFGIVNATDAEGDPTNQEALDAFLVGTFYGFQLMLQIDAETVARKKAEHEAQVADKQRKRAQADAEAEAKKAAERGVGILMPEGRSKPTGFGGPELGHEPQPEAEAEAEAVTA